jgi:mannose-6-phosphate isomerase-like protein (cupin superfamily)
MHKIWGTTEQVYHSPTVSRHSISINANHHCSIHYHKYKTNIFAIDSGELAVINYEGLNSSFVLLTAGDYYSVPPLLVHSFYAISNVTAHEIYCAQFGHQVDEQDIVRFNEGGVCLDLEQFVRNIRHHKNR